MNTETWDRAAFRYQQEFDPSDRAVHYGSGVPDDTELRILPSHLGGKRVLDLGCGAGQSAIAFARMGARTIAVDSSPELLGVARSRAEHEAVRVDFHLGDLCELAFVPAESIDLVLCAATLDYIEDLDRVLRSAHRVLRPQGIFVFTLEHPFRLCLEVDAPGGAFVARPYSDTAPVKVERYGEAFLVYPRTISGVVGSLTRAGFRTETLTEPVPAGERVPVMGIWRARKDGR